MSLDTFTDAYITCALWSTMDNSDENTGGNPLDYSYFESDIAPETMRQMQSDCAAFYAAHSAQFTESNCTYRNCPIDEYAGHDFWLTRNGHGAGFWDGDWRQPIASELTDAAHAFGEFELYVGDDGMIYA